MEVKRHGDVNVNDDKLFNLIHLHYCGIIHDEGKRLKEVAKSMFQNCLDDIENDSADLDAYIPAMAALTIRAYWTDIECKRYIGMLEASEPTTPEAVSVTEEKKKEVVVAEDEEASPSDPKKRRRDDLPDLAKIVEEAKAVIEKNEYDNAICEQAVAAARHFFEKASTSDSFEIKYNTSLRASMVYKKLVDFYPDLAKYLDWQFGTVIFRVN